MDKKNTRIVNALLKNARISISDLVKEACLSAPATAERLRKLEEQGVITGYKAIVDLRTMGHAVSAVIRVKPFAGKEPKVIKYIQASESILKAYNVTGEYAFVLEVSLASTTVLDTMLEEMSQFCITDTSVILSDVTGDDFRISSGERQ